MNKKTYFFFLLCFFINLKCYFSYFEKPITIDRANENNSANWNNEETVKFSKTLDMGQCTCNLTSHCDHRCCCDNTCSDDIRKKWTDEKICKNIPKNRMESFKCLKSKEHKEEEFKYNNKKAGINIKDHINNIMCIYHDNSGDMGNFYVNEVNEESLKETKDNWLNKFFDINQNGGSRRLQEQGRYKYGDIINNFALNKPDSNGNCISAKISYLIPFESSCNYSKEFTEDYITYINDYKYKIIFQNSENDIAISEITYIIEYDNDTITNTTINVLKTIPESSHKIKFKVLWKKKNVDMNKKLPSGYFQGTPIKIAKKKGNNFVYNKKGFFIAMNNKNGGFTCPTDLNNAANPSPILFKNNIIFSCRRDGNGNSYIENQFCGKELKLAKSPDIAIEEANQNSSNWIPLNLICPNLENDEDLNINLLILTSKKGKENSPYEHIEYAKIDSPPPKSGGRGIITLTIKFVELSYSSLINNREGKITSLLPLPEEILKKLR